MEDTLKVDLTAAHHGEDYDSSFELDSDVERKKKQRTDLAVKPRDTSQVKANKSEFVDAYSREEGRAQRYHLLALDAYARHKKFINDYVLYYSGSTSLLKRDESRDRTDLDIIRENHRFLWTDDDSVDTWGRRIAKKYYDKLFKEYTIADLSRYKENKIALRWRVEKEVVDGKGQFICGNKFCSEREGLRSWEVNFVYMEHNEKKQTLVKLRLCAECSYRLNYHNQKKEIKAKKRKTSPDSIPTKKQKLPNEDQSSSEQKEPASTLDAKSSEDGSENTELWKGPVQLEDKSRDEEFEDYLEDLFL